MAQDSHRRLLRYMMGWHKGAGHGAFTDKDMEDLDFKRGWTDGRTASHDAHTMAGHVYGATLSTIKPMEQACK